MHKQSNQDVKGGDIGEVQENDYYVHSVFEIHC